MSTKWRKHGAVTVLLAVGLAVTACDPGGGPTDPPTTDPTSDVTSEPTEPDTTAGPPEIDPPEPPDGMDVDDHQGAILAAGHFLDLYAYMRTTGDTARFEAMSGPDCEFCSSTISSVVEMHGYGNWIEGGELAHDLDEATAEFPTADRPEYVVHLFATRQPYTLHYADGTDDSVGDELVLRMAIGVQYIGGRFIVLGVDYEER